MKWKSMLKYQIILLWSQLVLCSNASDYLERKSLRSHTLNLENMTISGSGCNNDNVDIISDGKFIKISFSDYYAQTDHDLTLDKKYCNLSMPINMDKGKQIRLSQIE